MLKQIRLGTIDVHVIMPILRRAGQHATHLDLLKYLADHVTLTILLEDILLVFISSLFLIKTTFTSNQFCR